jgi:putative endonuclease
MWDINKRFRRAQMDTVSAPSHLELGERGEELANRFLIQQEYRIVTSNFVTPIGYSRNGRQITGEIDIIAYDTASKPFILAFVEVKTRRSAEIAAPQSAVDIRKQRQIVRVARVYRRLMAIEDEPFRYDVVSIIVNPLEKFVPTLFRGYFSQRRFERASMFSVDKMMGDRLNMAYRMRE